MGFFDFITEAARRTYLAADVQLQGHLPRGAPIAPYIGLVEPARVLAGKAPITAGAHFRDRVQTSIRAIDDDLGGILPGGSKPIGFVNFFNPTDDGRPNNEERPDNPGQPIGIGFITGAVVATVGAILLTRGRS